MNIAFSGLRHDHIYALAALVQSSDECHITGWWENDAEARTVGAKHFSQPFYSSYEALLSDPAVQAVAIGDYYGIRGQRVIAALRSGKHVICDKPICTSLDELDQIEKLITENNLMLGSMLDLRYEPALRHMQKMVKQGELGEIKTAFFTGQHPLNWGVRPKWYFEKGKHGGTFNDIAIHGIDAIQFLTGQTWTKNLYARQWNAFAVHSPDFKDCAQCVAELSNGANVMADVSYSAPSPQGFHHPAYWRFTLWGTKGMAECCFGNNTITIMQTGDRLPKTLEAPMVQDNCLTDFMHEINGESVVFGTQSILDSSRKALQLQLYADQKG